MFFPNIPVIPYEGPASTNPMAFKYYDAEKVILGKTMKEHLPFAMAWWHNLCATGTTGKMVAEATGLQITRYLSGMQGGSQQISARIACDEIDLLLFFRDPLTVKANEPNEADMLRLCDVRSIPVATNIATAEVLIHGLDRGDLDWRDIVRGA
jgi:methylglyoxal synthase